MKQVCPADPTLRQFSAWWLAAVAPTEVSPATAVNYEWCLRAHVLPALGRIKMAELHPEHLDTMLRFLAASQSKSVVRLAKSVVSKICRHAVLKRRMAANPALQVHMPQKCSPPRKGRAMTEAECRAFREASRGDEFERLWAVALGLGLRPGEVVGLCHDAIGDGTVTIKRFVRREMLLGEDGRRHRHLVLVEGVKTDRPGKDTRRTVEAPDWVMTALWEQAHQQRRTWLQYGGPRLLFSEPDGLLLDPSTRIDYHFKRVCRRAGLGVDWHLNDLRHTLVSLMSREYDQPTEAIARYVGHSSDMDRGTYQHDVQPVHRLGGGLDL